MQNLILGIVLIAMGIFLYRQYQRDSANIKNDRGSLLDRCVNLFEQPNLVQQGAGFPRLSGIYDGFEVQLELVADTLAVRKVPPLWLMVTVKGRHMVTGNLDLIVRPQNNEFYSPAWQWEGQIEAPAGWPQHSLIKYQQTLASIKTLGAFVPVLFADEHMKELLVMPASLRLTYLARQAERGEYMLMRNSIFDATPLDAEVIANLIKQAIAIRRALESEQDE